MINAMMPIAAFVVLAGPGVQREDAAVASLRIPMTTRAMPNSTTNVTTTAVGKTKAKIPIANATSPKIISKAR
jgi:hypothetical protein